MKVQAPGFAVRRVVIAEDAGYDSDLLPIAASVAERLGAELVGLFIEDANLFRLAAHPHARHASRWTGAPLFDTERLASDLQALASRARSDLAKAAERLGLQWSFQVVRGEVVSELSGATSGEDLVIVGTASRLAGLEARLPSPLRRAARNITRPTLLLTPRATLALPLAVIQPESRLADRALLAAARLLGPPPQTLEVLVLGRGPEAVHAGEQARHRLLEDEYAVHLRLLEEPSVARIRHAAAEADLLVVPADLPWLAEIGPEALLEGVDRPVLVVH